MLKKNIKQFIHDCIFNMYSRLAYRLAKWYPSYRRVEESEHCEMLILTVAFNNEQLIERQIELIRDNIKDENYRYMVADNSTNSQKRKAIKHVCQKYGVFYIAIPKTICFLTSHQCAISHGAALNWVYYHFLRKMKPKCFAVIDHDIFPVKPYNLTSALGEKNFYGVLRSSGKEWYIWPGWCIFNFAKFTDKPNFEPIFTKKNFLDTGGSNYLCHYHKYNVQDIPFPIVKTWRYKKTEGLSRHCDILHSDYIQIVNESWLHIINGSNYANIPGKEDMIHQILSNTAHFWDAIHTTDNANESIKKDDLFAINNISEKNVKIDKKRNEIRSMALV